MKVTGLNTFNFFLVITVTGMAPPALTNFCHLRISLRGSADVIVMPDLDDVAIRVVKIFGAFCQTLSAKRPLTSCDEIHILCKQSSCQR